MSNKVKDIYVFWGFFGPVFISLVVFGIDIFFGGELFCALSKITVSEIPLGEYIHEFSSYPCLLVIAFSVSLLLFPFHCFYWWKVMPVPPNKNKMPFYKAVLGVVFLILLYITLWFMNVEVLSSRSKGFYVSIFEYPFLFLLMILFPIYFSAWMVAGLVKYFQFKKQTGSENNCF